MLEQPDLGVEERHLDDGSPRRSRQHAIHVFDRRHFGHPERNDRFQRCEGRDAHRHEARVSSVAKATK
jgi:hypothetical protein